MPHGADLLRCLERVRSAQNTEESTSCTLSTKIEPDSRGLVPAIHVCNTRRKDVDARNKSGHDEMTAIPLASRIALVTGASRGIGYATALALAKAGAHMVAVARTQGGLEELDDEIRKDGGSATLVPLNMTDMTASPASAPRCTSATASSTSWSAMPASPALPRRSAISI